MAGRNQKDAFLEIVEGICPRVWHGPPAYPKALIPLTFALFISPLMLYRGVQSESYVTVDDLPTKLGALSQQGFDARIYVRAANGVNYGRFAEVMSIITAAGY